MDIITTHLNADFDALASMLAVRHLYPDAVMVFSGSQEKSIRDFFLSSASFIFPFKRLKDIDLDEVSRLIIVDTRQPDRIGAFAALAVREDIATCVYDHHPDAPGDIRGTEVELVAPVGATVTLLSELLAERGIAVSADEATMMMIGLFEDTSSLTNESTTARDFRAGARLLAQGAVLSLVADVINTTLDRRQVSLLNDLLTNLSEVIVRGQRIVITEAGREEYVPEVALIVHRLRDMEKIDVIFALVRLEGKVYLIARSRNPRVNVARVAERFAGGGHQYAAAAVSRDLTLVQCREQLLAALEEVVEPALTAAELMTAPVLTVAEDASLGEAAEILTRYNINVLPVVDAAEENGRRLTGIITRQVVEKGVYHGLKEVAVREYMTTDYRPVEPEAELPRIQELIVERNQRFLPVVDPGGMVVGAITRKDLLRALHEQLTAGENGTGTAASAAGPRVRSVSSLMREQLPERALKVLKQLGELADRIEVGAFLVGGIVRDMLLRRDNLDIDIVVEGDGIALARSYAREHGCRCHTHETFRTAVIVFPDGFKVDVASTRMEYYDTPASLPKVSESSLKVDLYRRDFTINTLVVCLNVKNFGQLRDYFGAGRDLKEKTIRVLHNFSFVEDPTRIFRAVRFEQKFGFTIGRQTDHLIANAVRMGFVRRLDGRRIFAEFRQCVREADPLPIFIRLDEYDVWEQVFPGAPVGRNLDDVVPAVRDVLSWYGFLYHEQPVEAWQVYLLGFLHGEEPERAAAHVERLEMPDGSRDDFLAARRRTHHIGTELMRLSGAGNGWDLTPAELTRRLETLPLEAVLYLMAALENHHARRAISNYITTLQFIEPALTGHDLIAAGLAPGPRFKRLLERLRDARLNGEVDDRRGEERLLAGYLMESG
ncbi:MAG: CBS domain-containing protein [Deltaproteobacteria bacterium]|nr:CBS domain-containing protein [Candidatus Anaeroferrophillacea bacterium]